MQAQADKAGLVTSLQADALSWISETELASGEIPAALASDLELGISKGVSEGSRYQRSTGQVKMGHGSVLFAPTEDSVIKTSFGTVKVAAGSLVLILSLANGLAVYDLDDLHRSAVSISAQGKQFQLYPGMNLLITSDRVKTFDEVNPAQLFGYRNTAEHEVGGGLKAFSSEFHVPSAVRVVQPLRLLVNSNHPNARRLAQHLLKTTAATLQMNAGNGSYQQIQRPATTAWAN